MIKIDLKDKTAIVTGASKGLGSAASIALAEAGCNIVLVARNERWLEKKSEEINNLGVKSHVIKYDLSNLNDLNNIVIESRDIFGNIDILINNAGIIRRSKAEDYSLNDWNDVINTNLNATFLLAQAVGKSMILNKTKGKIINIASLLSFSGGLNVVGYTASKHAIVGLTKSLANEWSKFGINVNAIAPGYFLTDATNEIQKDQERFNLISQRIPLGRWGEIDDIKGSIQFLSSSMSNYVSGHVLTIDGGWLAS
ncbi:MAG: SDR family oxidoreductase [Chlorobi bacterium]|nr:SDR family oxidoreductase [Chlorobiota bacterium]